MKKVFLKKKIKDPLVILVWSKLGFLLVKKGQKVNSKKILYNLLYKIKLDNKLETRNVLNFYKKALKNVLIPFIIKQRKRGKRLTEVPVILNSVNSVYFNTLRFILKILNKSKGDSSFIFLLQELLDAYGSQGKMKKVSIEFNKVVVKNRKFIVLNV